MEFFASATTILPQQIFKVAVSVSYCIYSRCLRQMLMFLLMSLLTTDFSYANASSVTLPRALTVVVAVIVLVVVVIVVSVVVSTDADANIVVSVATAAAVAFDAVVGVSALVVGLFAIFF